MREIKTEAQTLDLSKKVTVEVSLAELIVLSVSLLEVDSAVIEENIVNYTPYSHLSRRIMECTPLPNDLMNEVDEIIADHIPKEDE